MNKQNAGKGSKDKRSKKDQLITMLSKPNGMRASLIGEKLGWQAHSVRAALSGLRKQGFVVEATTSAKTGMLVYAITGKDEGGQGGDAGAADAAGAPVDDRETGADVSGTDSLIETAEGAESLLGEDRGPVDVPDDTHGDLEVPEFLRRGKRKGGEA